MRTSPRHLSLACPTVAAQGCDAFCPGVGISGLGSIRLPLPALMPVRLGLPEHSAEVVPGPGNTVVKVEVFFQMVRKAAQEGP
jgi:hypothetical protein